MDKDGLLRTIAETGYSAGFGARKTFATFDIIEKAPGWIGFVSFAVGVFALFTNSLAAKIPSAILLIAGFGSLYFGMYRGGEYEVSGKKLLNIQNRLRTLYRNVKAGADLAASEASFHLIEAEFHTLTVSKQVFLSDWYAHYKFFGQSQIGWMDEQLNFRFWRDKVPFSAKVLMAAIVLAVAGWAVWCFAHR